MSIKFTTLRFHVHEDETRLVDLGGIHGSSEKGLADFYVQASVEVELETGEIDVFELHFRPLNRNNNDVQYGGHEMDYNTTVNDHFRKMEEFTDFQDQEFLESLLEQFEVYAKAKLFEMQECES